MLVVPLIATAASRAEDREGRLDRDPAHQQRVGAGERRRAAVRAVDAPEWQLLRDALEARGIDSADLGRFVSNTS